MNPFNDRDNDVRSITGIAAIYGKDELPLNPIWNNVTAPVSALFEDPLSWYSAVYGNVFRKTQR